MKKTIISAALAVAIGVGGYMGFSANNSSSDQLSDVMLANIEAIAQGEFDIRPGSPCYNGGYYDFTKPDAVVCDVPCKAIPYNIGTGSTSICLY